MSDVVPRAIYDANVLYDAHVRDLCLWLAVAGAVEARWTHAIHDEWTQHLLKNRPDLEPERIQRLRQAMDEAVPDCLVTEFEPLIPQIELPDPDDRHVVAAAITCAADMIVTCNLADFPAAVLDRLRIDALSPDAFVMRLMTLAPQKVCWAARQHRTNLTRPAVTLERYLGTLRSRGLPMTASRLPEMCEQL